MSNKFLPPSSHKYITSLNPATTQPFALIPESDQADVDAAVAAAKAAFPSWSETPRTERSRLLMKVAELLEARLEEFAIAESRDQGKPVSVARTVDIPRAIHNFRFFATALLHTSQRKTEVDGVALNYTLQQPVGVAGMISPWNLPLYLATWKIAPCLASGCTAVLKPSEFTSVTMFMLCSIFVEAGIPSGVVNVVFGDGPKAGDALVKHKDVPLVSFTGGTKTGEIIYRNCSKGFKKMSLELGGKNANVIFADADLEKAVAGSVRSSFSNQGEICLCGSRIFVEESVMGKFLEKFKVGTEKLVVGDPADPATNLGPLVSQQHLEKVMSYVELAKKEGGTILTGGELVKGVKACDGGFFMKPTIITGYEF
ncbi:Aldehyde dehydrogenase 8 member A1 [Irineochytrium annulatum]|nr:Aldehyde dehydrogenase 8 member A1 [Irineochytrium annulatum]